jgi:outer membrane protein assembly factor BamB
MAKLVGCLFAVCWLLVNSAVGDDGGGTEAKQYWPQWRGPLGTGVAPDANPPTVWSESKNIRWKTELPGSGHSTPIIWADRIFVTTAVPYGNVLQPKYSGAPGAHDNVPVRRRHRFMVLAINRRDGKIIWERTVRRALPHEGGHYTASLASNSPVTDGKHVFACFGSRGLYCIDFDGNLLWNVNLGKILTKHGHGEGSSPALFGDTLIVNVDHEGQSFVIAFDKRTGKQRWKVMRQEVTSWATPIVVEHGGKPQVIISGTNRVRGYDLADGRLIWECGGLSANIVASPVAANGIVYAASSYETRALLAIRLEGAKGDVTGTNQVVWTRKRGTPYVPSPLLYGDSLYFLRHYQGILSRVDVKTGKEQGGPFRLGGILNVYASPVGAANRVYITDRNGTTLVISHDDKPRVLAVNRLNDGFSASAAVAGRELYLRGQQNLYSIAEE